MADLRFLYGTSFNVGGESGSEVKYTPFIETSMALAGYRVTHMSTGETRFIYLNVSDHDPDSKPNVFLYEGLECDPAQDTPHHFCNLDFSEAVPQ